MTENNFQSYSYLGPVLLLLSLDYTTPTKEENREGSPKMPSNLGTGPRKGKNILDTEEITTFII